MQKCLIATYLLTHKVDSLTQKKTKNNGWTFKIEIGLQKNPINLNHRVVSAPKHNKRMIQ